MRKLAYNFVVELLEEVFEVFNVNIAAIALEVVVEDQGSAANFLRHLVAVRMNEWSAVP